MPSAAYEGETSLFMTLLRSLPANKYSQLDLGMGISKAKVVRHRISEQRLLIVCVSCGLTSSVRKNRVLHGFVGGFLSLYCKVLAYRHCAMRLGGRLHQYQLFP